MVGPSHRGKVGMATGIDKLGVQFVHIIDDPLRAQIKCHLGGIPNEDIYSNSLVFGDGKRNIRVGNNKSEEKYIN